MRKDLALMLALLFLCTGCTQRAETPSPTPEEPSTALLEPAPTPSPRPLETVEDLLSELEVGLAQDRYSLRGWMDPGSGPTPYTLYASACGQALRDLLTSVDWQVGEEPVDEEAWREWEYNVDLFFEKPRLLLSFRSMNNTVYCYRQDWYREGCGAFHAEEISDLCAQLLKLWPGPLFRYQLVGVPTTGDWREEGRAYAKAFEEDYLASGHITDFHLDALELTEVAPREDSGGGHYITLNYSILPANPDDPAWEDSKAYIDQPEFSGDGRIYYSQKLSLVPMADGYTRPGCPY